MMKIFLSWSGEKSKDSALAFKTFIADVIQSAEPWMSKMDISAGQRWSPEIDRELEASEFGILFLTKENLTAPWILFEAGALAKSVKDARVCPYLMDLEPTDIPQGPLTKFQAKRATKDETRELIESINKAKGEELLSSDRLQRAFDRCWPELERKFIEFPDYSGDGSGQRTQDDMVREVLELARFMSAGQDEIKYMVANLLAHSNTPVRGTGIMTMPTLSVRTGEDMSTTTTTTTIQPSTGIKRKGFF